MQIDLPLISSSLEISKNMLLNLFCVIRKRARRCLQITDLNPSVSQEPKA